MAAKPTLLMLKPIVGGVLKSSFDDFGFAICEIEWPEVETCDLASREWPGEHGEDVYYPPEGMKLKAYDVEVEFLYIGNKDTSYAKYKALRNYLTGISGDGAKLRIFDQRWGVGRVVHLKKISNLEPFSTNVDEGVGFKATFHVPDPTIEVVIGYLASGDGITLTIGTA